MIEKATGLILRTRPLTETSLIVHWLTRHLGRIATVAKGARRPKSPFRGQLDLFYLSDLSFDRSLRSELHHLREVSLLETHSGLRSELDYLEQASYCAQLIEQATETESPLPGIFELMLGLLQHLLAHPPQPRTVFAFELRLLDQLGLKPDLDRTKLDPETRRLVNALTESAWPALTQLRATGAQVRALNQFLHGFISYHLGRIPGSRMKAVGLEPAGKTTDRGG